MLKLLKFLGTGLIGLNLIFSGIFILSGEGKMQESTVLEDIGNIQLLVSDTETDKSTGETKVATADTKAKKTDQAATAAQPAAKPKAEAETKLAKAEQPAAAKPEPKPAAKAPEKPKPKPTPIPVAQCFKVGPIHEKADVGKLIKEFKDIKLNAVIASEDKGEFLGYWVYLPPERSLALARLKVEELKTKGISDVFLVKKEQPRLSISLGVYRNKLTAQRRQRAIRKLGYEPELSMRYKRKPETWLMVEATSETAPSKDGWKLILNKYKGVKYEKSGC